MARGPAAAAPASEPRSTSRIVCSGAACSGDPEALAGLDVDRGFLVDPGVLPEVVQ